MDDGYEIFFSFFLFFQFSVFSLVVIICQGMEKHRKNVINDLILYYLILIQWEATTRLDFLWRLQAQQEVQEMRDLREHNECLLHNILPAHVARHFLERNRHDQVYQSHI